MSNTPYYIGSAVQNSGVSETITLTLSGITVPANDTVYVFCGSNATAADSVSVTDSQGNSYNQVTDDTTEASAAMVVFSSTLAAQISSTASDYIQVTYNADAYVQVIIAVGDNNVGNGGTVTDAVTIAHGSSTAPSSGSSGTLSQTYEHAIACIFWQNSNTITWASPWSSHVLGSAHNGSGTSELQCSVAYQDVSATTALTGSGTLSGSATEWVAVIVTDETTLPTITTVVPSLIQGVSTTIPLVSTAGSGSGYSYSISSGALPSGISISGASLTGTATVNGVFNFTLKVTDSNGTTNTFPQTINVWPSGESGADAPISYANNILVLADSSFTVGMLPTWTNITNANLPSVTSEVSLFGSAALIWSASATGNTIIETAAYPVIGNTAYTASGFVLPAGLRECYIGVNFYDINSILVGTSGGSSDVTGVGENTSAFQSWQPCQQACTSPETAVSAKIFIEVDGVYSGEVTALDGVFFMMTNTQILVDWENPSFGAQSVTGNVAGDDFMDITPWVRQDVGATITRGRQDSISEVQAASGNFCCQNDSGIFTKFNTASIINYVGEYGGQVDLQRRVQINRADQNGVWHTRFDGVISEIDYTFDDTGNTSQASITCTDVLAELNRQNELNCWTASQIIANEPLYLWPLNDTGNVTTLGGNAGNTGTAGVAAETSGNNGPPMRLVCADTSNPTAATITWQNGTGGVEILADAVVAGFPDGSEYWVAGSNAPTNWIRGLDSGTVGPYSTPFSNVYFAPKVTTQSAQNTYVGNVGYMLTTSLPTNSIIAPIAQGADYSFECFFFSDPGLPAIANTDVGPFIFWSMGSGRLNSNNINAGFYLNSSGEPNIEITYYAHPPGYGARSGYTGPSPLKTISVPWTLDSIQIPHHFVAVMKGDASTPTITFYVDGTNIGSWDISYGQTFDTLNIGGCHGGTGNWWGGVSLFAMYDYALTEGQIITDCMLGQYGMWEQTTDNCIALLAGLANVPTYWLSTDLQSFGYNGLTMTDYQDISSSNAITSMQTYEQTEAGFLFTSATGQLTFHTRDWRMGYGAPDLYLPPDTYDASMGYELIDQFQNNEAGFSTNLYSTGGGYTNTQSQLQYGDYTTNYGSLLSPVELPFITWNRAYAALGIPQFELWADPVLTDTAQWFANAKSVPYLTPGALAIDMLTLNPTTGITKSKLFALEIDNMVAPSGTLPASFPGGTASMEWFIEGVTEAFSLISDTITFYTSPAETQRAWRIGDSTYGVLDSTTRVGISHLTLTLSSLTARIRVMMLALRTGHRTLLSLPATCLSTVISRLHTTTPIAALLAGRSSMLLPLMKRRHLAVVRQRIVTCFLTRVAGCCTRLLTASELTRNTL